MNLRLQRFRENLRKSKQISWKSAKITMKFEKIERFSIFNFENAKKLTNICWNIEVWAVQKHVNLVDLVKSFPTSIYLQNLASVQQRTSLSKFV